MIRVPGFPDLSGSFSTGVVPQLNNRLWSAGAIWLEPSPENHFWLAGFIPGPGQSVKLIQSVSRFVPVSNGYGLWGIIRFGPSSVCSEASP